MRGNLGGLPLTVIDTGGYDDRGSVSVDVKSQVERALNTADVVLFLVDARSGITPVDVDFSKWLRKKMGQFKAKPEDIILVANKTEGGKLSEKVLESIEDALQLGLGDPFLISASHGDGLADMAEYLVSQAREKKMQEEDEDFAARKEASKEKITIEERTIQLAIMGRPNVSSRTNSTCTCRSSLYARISLIDRSESQRY